MKKLLVLLLIGMMLLMFPACKKTCKYDWCDSPAIDGGEYCKKHTCTYPGCKNSQGLWGDEDLPEYYYCEEHYDAAHAHRLSEESGYSVLTINPEVTKDNSGRLESVYATITNNGLATYKNIRVKVTFYTSYGDKSYEIETFIGSSYLESYYLGEYFDSDNMGLYLAPGDSAYVITRGILDKGKKFSDYYDVSFTIVSFEKVTE